MTEQVTAVQLPHPDGTYQMAIFDDGEWRIVGGVWHIDETADKESDNGGAIIIQGNDE